MSLHYLKLIILLSLISLVVGLSSTNITFANATTSIFGRNMCEIQCGKRSFTLCEEFNKTVKSCKFRSVKFYSNSEIEKLNIKSHLIVGHNGLRDRIATRMRISNMIYVQWDQTLQKLSLYWAHICRPFEDDRCARLAKPLRINEIFHYYSAQKDNERYISMNRMCIQADYLPNEFIEMALNVWYFGKNVMKPPTYTSDKFMNYGSLTGNNNFTHLSHALTYRFGCTIARYDNNFCIFCYYFPYYPSPNNTMIFLHGKPTSNCPDDYPLESADFPAICSTNLLTDNPEEDENDIAVAVLVCKSLMIFCVLILNFF